MTGVIWRSRERNLPSLRCTEEQAVSQVCRCQTTVSISHFLKEESDYGLDGLISDPSDAIAVKA